MSTAIRTIKREDLIAGVRSSRVLAQRTLPGLVDVVSKMYLREQSASFKCNEPLSWGLRTT
jgi:hypothetical protein